MHFTSIFFAAFLFAQLSEDVWCERMPPQAFQAIHPTRANEGSWNNQPQQTSRPASNSNRIPKTRYDLSTDFHDRVSLLTSLNEDLRTRLNNIERKIDRLESKVIGGIESIAAQQTDIGKRLDTLDYMEHQTKHNTDKLIQREGGNLTMETMYRTARQIDRLPQMPSNDEKFDSLGTLLTSTRLAISDLERNLSNFTNTVTRRLNNIQRQNQRQNHRRQKPNTSANEQTSEPLITSCAQGHPTANGILRLQLTPDSEPFYVRCEDQEVFGGGWTIIQNRFNGELNFFRGWLEYQAGFGNLFGEFFIGLDKLHALTSSAVHELLIFLQDFDGKSAYARYNLFAIGSEKEDYVLNLLGEYEGDAGDSFTYHAGSKFSTFDNDNDGSVDSNCAKLRNGAWWYNWCEMSNLNGKYFTENYNNTPLFEGMYWNEFRGPSYSLKAVKMMIRPVDADDELQRR